MDDADSTLQQLAADHDPGTGLRILAIRGLLSLAKRHVQEGRQ